MMNHHNITSESLINEEETSITTLHNSQSYKAHFNLQVASKNQMLQTNAMIHGQYILLTKLMRWKVKNTNKYYPLAESQVGQNVTVLNWKFNFMFGGYLALWFDWMPWPHSRSQGCCSNQEWLFPNINFVNNGDTKRLSFDTSHLLCPGCYRGSLGAESSQITGLLFIFVKPQEQSEVLSKIRSIDGGRDRIWYANNHES